MYLQGPRFIHEKTEQSVDFAKDTRNLAKPFDISNPVSDPLKLVVTLRVGKQQLCKLLDTGSKGYCPALPPGSLASGGRENDPIAIPGNSITADEQEDASGSEIGDVMNVDIRPYVVSTQTAPGAPRDATEGDRKRKHQNDGRSDESERLGSRQEKRCKVCTELLSSTDTMAQEESASSLGSQPTSVQPPTDLTLEGKPGRDALDSNPGGINLTEDQEEHAIWLEESELPPKDEWLASLTLPESVKDLALQLSTRYLGIRPEDFADDDGGKSLREEVDRLCLSMGGEIVRRLPNVRRIWILAPERTLAACCSNGELMPWCPYCEYSLGLMSQ